MLVKRQVRVIVESQQFNALKAFDTADIIRNIFKPNVRPSENNFFCFTQIQRHFVSRRPFLYMFDFGSSCNITIFRYQKGGIISEFYDNVTDSASDMLLWLIMSSLSLSLLGAPCSEKDVDP